MVQISTADSIHSDSRKKSIANTHSTIYQAMICEHSVVDGSRLRSYPAEYIEAIYIITFLLWKHLKITQEQTAELLGIKCKDYNEKMGITPISDYKYYYAKLDVALSMDDKERLQCRLTNVGRLIATIPCKKITGVTNEATMIRNLPAPPKGLHLIF